MKIFISWSGEHSRQVADALRRLLRGVIQSSAPWVSANEIRAGDRWSETIAGELHDANFGIICLTPSNQNSPWINFEAGAISKNIGEGKVVPYLHGLTLPNMINGPLKQFQAKESDRQGTTDLIRVINSLTERPLDEDTLQEAIDVYWDRFSDNLSRISISPQDEALSQRSTDDKIDELLEILREQSTNSDTLNRMSRDIKFISMMIKEDSENIDPDTIKDIILKLSSMQLRAFLKAGKFSIDDINKNIIISYDEKTRFHYKNLLTKSDDLEHTVLLATNGKYGLSITGPKDSGVF